MLCFSRRWASEFRKLTAAAAASILWMVGLATLADAQEYVLRPGDRLSLMIAGIGVQPVEAAIEADGSLSLPFLGEIKAAGRTISDLRGEAKQRLSTVSVQQYTTAGVPYSIAIRPQNVLLNVSAYRPIIVAGDVAAPGEITFREGLTPRSALALAGGSAAADLFMGKPLDPLAAIRQRGDFEATRYELGLALGELWLVESELIGQETAPPDAEAVGLDADTLEQILAIQRRALAIRLATVERQRAFNADAVEQSLANLEVLTRQMANQKDALKNDEEEEARVGELVERGIARMDRFTDLRRNTVQSAQRLLAIEQALTRQRDDLAQRTLERDQFDELRKTDLFRRRDEAMRAVGIAKVRLAQAKQLLAASNAGGFLDDNVNFSVSTTVFRRSEHGAMQAEPILLDAPLFPGDLVEYKLNIDVN